MKEQQPVYTHKQIRQIETNEGIFRLMEIDYGVFKKSQSEKAELLTIKLAHKRKLVKAGFSPKKTMNI